MIKRLRHRNLMTAPQGEQMDHDQQTTPIFELIAQALHKWDILGLAKYDNLAYEDVVIGLLQHLEPLSDRNDVERLIFQALAERQGSSDFSPDQSLMLKALADNIATCWAKYLRRREQSSLAQA